MGRYASFALVLVSILGAEVAWAQEWLSDRRYSEGIGVKLSDGLVLHPGIGAEAGYDSNVFYRSEEPFDAARLRITPHVDLSTLPPQRLGEEEEERVGPKTEFRLSLAAIYQEYLTSDELGPEQRDVGVQAGLRLVLFPKGRWSFTLSDEFTRTNHPTTDVIVTGPTDHDQNRAEADLRYAPGGGNFEFHLGYAFYLSYFEREEYQNLGNHAMHEVYERIRWRWLPKTALLEEARVSPVIYSGDTHPDATAVRTRIGINGLLTARLSLLVLAGYGVAFYSAGDDFDSFLAQAEIRYIIGPVSNLRIGYERDFHQALISNYYLRDRGYLTYSHMFGGRFLLTVEGGLSYNAFSPILPGAGCGGEPERSDVILEAGVFGEYRLQDWLALNASARQQSDVTDYECSGYGAGYSRQEVFAGVRAFY